jgi:hypothetical protein
MGEIWAPCQLEALKSNVSQDILSSLNENFMSKKEEKSCYSELNSDLQRTSHCCQGGL